MFTLSEMHGIRSNVNAGCTRDRLDAVKKCIITLAGLDIHSATGSLGDLAKKRTNIVVSLETVRHGCLLFHMADRGKEQGVVIPEQNTSLPRYRQTIINIIAAPLLFQARPKKTAESNIQPRARCPSTYPRSSFFRSFDPKQRLDKRQTEDSSQQPPSGRIAAAGTVAGLRRRGRGGGAAALGVLGEAGLDGGAVVAGGGGGGCGRAGAGRGRGC